MYIYKHTCLLGVVDGDLLPRERLRLGEVCARLLDQLLHLFWLFFGGVFWGFGFTLIVFWIFFVVYFFFGLGVGVSRGCGRCRQDRGGQEGVCVYCMRHFYTQYITQAQAGMEKI